MRVIIRVLEVVLLKKLSCSLQDNRVKHLRIRRQKENLKPNAFPSIFIHIYQKEE